MPKAFNLFAGGFCSMFLAACYGTADDWWVDSGRFDTDTGGTTDTGPTLVITRDTSVRGHTGDTSLRDTGDTGATDTGSTDTGDTAAPSTMRYIAAPSEEPMIRPDTPLDRATPF